MMARILSSLSAASNASIISCCMVPLKALSLSGRFSVMVRICSATSYLIVSYAIGGSSLVCLLFLILNRHSGLVATQRPGMTKRELFLRRHRPRLLRAAQAIERLGHAEYAEIVKTAADDLNADRKALLV